MLPVGDLDLNAYCDDKHHEVEVIQGKSGKVFIQLDEWLSYTFSLSGGNSK